MANFLFWNMARKPLSEALARLAARHQIDVMLLAECELAPKQILSALNRDTKNWQWAAPFLSLEPQKISIFTRFDTKQLAPRLDSPRWTIRELRWPGLPPIVVAGVHLPSKWNVSDESQAFYCVELAGDIRAVEAQVGHGRTLVVGDFNMNPFEQGMLAANGLHGEASRRVAAGGSRKVEGHSYPFFYNPMWNFFGDAGRGPGGTYFWRNAQLVRLGWNIFDQVLLRPDLLPFFDTARLEILSGDGEISFLTRAGTPTTRAGSDHLPIKFAIAA